MPRFHFNIFDADCHVDIDGLELSDRHAARAEGLRAAAEMVRDPGQRTDETEEWRLEVTDAAGAMLFRMKISVVEAPLATPGATH